MSRVATLRIAAIAALALFAAACGDERESTPPSPPPQPPAAQPEPVPPRPAETAPPLPADGSVAKEGATPQAGTETAAAAPAAAAGDAAKGAPLYATYCASCHGPKGCADGPLSATLNPKPAKHCDGNYMNALSDEHIFKTIKEGGQAVGKSPLMAPWGGTLTDAQIHDLVAFVRSLADPPYRPQR